MEVYRSPYEAYPFLSDPPNDLRCDFELLTDEIASRIGLLRAMVEEEQLRAELLWLCELVYHMNPTLRTRLTITEEERDRLLACVSRLQEESRDRCEQFVLPQGSQSAGVTHLLRVQCKALVRLLYRHMHQGHRVPDLLIDLANLLSGYFFHLALTLNEMGGMDEVPFSSRNYIG